MSVVGLDIGRRNVKLYDGKKYISFPSFVGEWRDIKLKNTLCKRSFDVKHNNERYFAGVLAETESEFARQMLVEDKVTSDALLLSLIALHHLDGKEFDIVTGLPANMHDDENKKKLTELLLGNHNITVNNKEKEFYIKRVRVAVEGGGAFWSKPKEGVVRVIDGGSRTINFITLRNKKYVDKESGALPFGFDTNKSTNIKQMTNRIAGELGKKWGKFDSVFVTGGMATELENNLKEYFPNVALLQNKSSLLIDGELIDLNLFSNAIGYYNIGRTV